MAVYRSSESVFDDLMRMQDEFNRYFEGRVTTYPPLNAWVSEEGLVVEVAVPGIDPQNLDVAVVGDLLTLTGKEQVAAEAKDRTYLKKERVEPGFTRSLELPFPVEAGKVNASCRNGILRITLPRAEADKPRKIKIEAA